MCCTICGLLIQSYMHAVYINDGDKAWIKSYFETLLDFATPLVHSQLFLAELFFCSGFGSKSCAAVATRIFPLILPNFHTLWMLSSFGKLVSNYEFQHTIFTVSKYELKNSHEFGNSPVANSTVKIQVGSFKMHRWPMLTTEQWHRVASPSPSQVVHLDVDSFVSTLAPGSGFADLRKRVRPGTAGCCGASPGFAQIKCQLDYPQVHNANWYHKPK